MQIAPGQPAPRRDYLTIAQLVVSGLGLVLSLVAAAGLGLFGLIGLVGSSINLNSVTALFSMVWISLLVAVFAVPSIVYSLQRLGAQAPGLPRVNGFRWASMLILLWPLALLLGNVVSRQPRIAWLLLPPLQILVVGLPIWWLFELLRRKLPSGSLQRGWGVVNFGIFITTPFVMIVEILAIVALVILFAIWAGTQPQIVNTLQGLYERLQKAQPSQEAILEIVGPYLRNPLVIISALAIIAGLMPMIEELLKPLAMWTLIGHRLTPAEGFVTGGLCGALFALVESLFYVSSPTDSGWGVLSGWALLATVRVGTELLHIICTALVGWGLASAWQNKAYLKLFATYLLAVILHGTWNAFSILTGLVGAINNPPTSLRPIISIARFAPVVLVLLLLVLLALLWKLNQHLQRESNLPPAGSPAETGAEAGPFSQSS